MLESCVMPVVRVLRLLGFDPASPGEMLPVLGASPTVPGKPMKKKKVSGTVMDLLAAGLLAENAKLVSTNGAWPAEATVLPNGKIEYDGQAFDTPSGAAHHLKGGAANGWDFWAIETDTGRLTLGTLRARLVQNM
jgi:hypothetical protein